jgi:hypothetical protein
MPRGGCLSEGSDLLSAVLIVLTVIVIAFIVCGRRQRRRRHEKKSPCAWKCVNVQKFDSRRPSLPATLATSPIRSQKLPIDALDASKAIPQRKGTNEALNLFYSSADIDPLIVGQGYAHRDNMRDVYAGRTAINGGSEKPSSAWGLQEFSSSGLPGDVGVDVGPEAIAEYEGSSLGFNDGIPSEWAFPSTPLRWYRPRREDHYGKDGPAVVDPDKLYPTYVPDHEPYVN